LLKKQQLNNWYLKSSRRQNKKKIFQFQKQQRKKSKMSQEETVAEAPKEFTITINISEANLAYKSDFSEPETIFWLEAVKNIVLNKTFEATGLKS
jgi:hypothetical protein